MYNKKILTYSLIALYFSATILLFIYFHNKPDVISSEKTAIRVGKVYLGDGGLGEETDEQYTAVLKNGVWRVSYVNNQTPDPESNTVILMCFKEYYVDLNARNGRVLRIVMKG